MLRRKTPETDVSIALDGVPASSRVIQVCHPDWRGVRASAEAFRTPVIALRDLATPAHAIVAHLLSVGTQRLVIQGWPPGASVLSRHAAASGIAIGVINHASLAQHGTDLGEAEAVSEILDLMHQGIIDRLGFVKRGLAEAFTEMGHRAYPLSNRLPAIPEASPQSLGAGQHVGVFFDPYWRKNVTTQVVAAMILGATAHVMHRPAVRYLSDARIVEHGQLPRDQFLQVLASTDLNLAVTLSECHPMLPMESYLLGVPCLVSRTSSLFTDDPDLLAITSVAELDDPTMIAARATELLAASMDVVPRAIASLRRSDAEAQGAWATFVT